MMMMMMMGRYLFIGLSAAAFALGVWLCGVDWTRGKELSKSHWNDAVATDKEVCGAVTLHSVCTT